MKNVLSEVYVIAVPLVEDFEVNVNSALKTKIYQNLSGDLCT